MTTRLVIGPTFNLPRIALAGMLKQAGIPRLDQIPRKLAMYLGSANITPEIRDFAAALADPTATIRADISVARVGAVALCVHVVVQ